MTHVVLATDGSISAEQAIHFLWRLPLEPPLRVTLATNVFVPAYGSEATDPLLMDFRDHQEAEATVFQSKAESMLRGKADSIDRQLIHGHIGHSIVEAAEKDRCDLVIMGAKGHSQIARMLLGSTSDYVATHAHCSVIVVREDHHESRSIPLNVTVGYNAAPASQRACEAAARLNWDPSTRLHLLSVVPLFQGFSQELMPNMSQYRSEQRAAAMRSLEEARQLFRGRSERVSMDIIESPHVGDSIVNEVHQRQSDLVVVGDSHRGSISRMLLGSVSRFVLRHAECSVWIARSA